MGSKSLTIVTIESKRRELSDCQEVIKRFNGKPTFNDHSVMLKIGSPIHRNALRPDDFACSNLSRRTRPVRHSCNSLVEGCFRSDHATGPRRDFGLRQDSARGGRTLGKMMGEPWRREGWALSLWA